MERRIKINGVVTEYYDINECNSIETIILLHSFPANKSLFESYIPFLKDHYRVVIPDFPGFGDDFKSNPCRTIKNYVVWLESFVNNLNLNNSNTIIYGISFGGLIVLNSYKFNKIKKIYIESTPLSCKHIHSIEDNIVNLLRFIPIKTLDKIKNSDTLSKYIIKIYKMVKPKGKIEFNDEFLSEYIKSVNLESLFVVNQILTKGESYKDMCDLRNSKYIFLYDKLDPTVKYEDIINCNKLNRERIVCTNYGVHAPSTHFTKEILKIVNLI
jgi:esterase/lipase